MDNLIFCLNATVPIFAIIVLGRWLRSKNFFTKQTLTDIDRLSFKVLLPILLFRDIAQGRITEQFDPVFFFFCAGATTVYFFAVWIGASIFLKDKSMVGAFTQGAFRGSQAILGVAFVQNLYGDAGLVLVVEATSGKAQDVVTALESYKQDQVAFYGNYAEFAQAQSNVENAIISSKGDRVVMVIASNECSADLTSAVDSALNS